jgi:hypothetical protein
MNDKRDDSFVDQLLDSTLERYRTVEPTAELERKILRRLEADEARSRRFRWALLPATATTVVALVAMMVYLNRRSVLLSPPPAESAVIAPVRPVGVQAPLHPVQRRLATRGGGGEVRSEGIVLVRRQERFPSPAPLSDEERLLLRYAEETPKEQLVVAELGERPLEALRIEPLSILPLTIEPTERNQHPN